MGAINCETARIGAWAVIERTNRETGKRAVQGKAPVGVSIICARCDSQFEGIIDPDLRCRSARLVDDQCTEETSRLSGGVGVVWFTEDQK